MFTSVGNYEFKKEGYLDSTVSEVSSLFSPYKTLYEFFFEWSILSALSYLSSFKSKESTLSSSCSLESREIGKRFVVFLQIIKDISWFLYYIRPL